MRRRTLSLPAFLLLLSLVHVATPAACQAQIALRSDEQRIEEALSSPTQFEFIDTPLGDVIDYLRDCHRIGIRIVIRDGNAEVLKQARPPNEMPITKNLKGMSLAAALRLTLSDVGLAYGIKDGSLLITTPEEAQQFKPLTRLYRIGDLTRPDPALGATVLDAGKLIALITQCVAPGSWQASGGKGAIVPLPPGTAPAIAVAQQCDVHEQIARLLANLRAAAELKPGQRAAVGARGVAEKKLLNYLAQTKVTGQFKQVPLREVLRHYADQYRLEVQIDEKALREAAINPSAPITLVVEHAEPLAVVLTKVLDIVNRGREKIFDEALKEWTAAQSAASAKDSPFRGVPGLSQMPPEPGRWTEQARLRQLIVPSLVFQVRGSSVRITTSHASDAEAASRPSTASERIWRALGEETQLEFVETPLADVVDYLKDIHGIEIQFYGPGMREAKREGDTPVTYTAKGVPLYKALREILRPLGLGAVVEDEVLIITSRQEAEKRLTTWVYSVDELAARGEASPWAGLRGDALVKRIVAEVAPESWRAAGGRGDITLVSPGPVDALVVLQTQEVHEKLVDILGLPVIGARGRRE